MKKTILLMCLASASLGMMTFANNQKLDEQHLSSDIRSNAEITVSPYPKVRVGSLSNSKTGILSTAGLKKGLPNLCNVTTGRSATLPDGLQLYANVSNDLDNSYGIHKIEPDGTLTYQPTSDVGFTQYAGFSAGDKYISYKYSDWGGLFEEFKVYQYRLPGFTYESVKGHKPKVQCMRFREKC